MKIVNLAGLRAKRAPPQVIEYIRNEAQLLMQLSSPFVVSLMVRFAS
jgi:hypothetical protein